MDPFVAALSNVSPHRLGHSPTVPETQCPHSKVGQDVLLTLPHAQQMKGPELTVCWNRAGGLCSALTTAARQLACYLWGSLEHCSALRTSSVSPQ